MQDVLGSKPAPAGQGPRNRSWVRVRLSDPAQAKGLADAGAFLARDGSLVAIYVGAHRGADVTVTRADGKTEKAGGEYVPAHFQLVDAKGHNLTTPVKDDRGHGEWRRAFLFADNPGVSSLAPVDDVRDLPPGRVFSARWLEALHNAGRPGGEALLLGESVHECRAGDFFKK